MIIHTHAPEEVFDILNNNDIPYKRKIKKPYKTHYEDFHWYGLPEFNDDPNLLKTTYIEVHNKYKEDIFRLLNQKPSKVSYVHYKKEEQKYKNYRYEITHEINPRYPIYVISKGRYEKRLTVDTLTEMNCPYKIVIEPQEYEQYAKHIPKENILVLPDEYLNKNQGGIPARNFCWEHSKQNGYRKHWILDDNIKGFYRWNYNVKLPVKSGVVFKVIEDYVKRFSNIGMAAMAYNFDIPAIHIERSMIVNNTKNYSCILINNNLMDKYVGRWEGKYNEDVDITIRTLKAGYCTVLLNNFLCGKQATGMKGGNNTIYEGCSHEGFLKKFQELQDKHPDCVKMMIKHKDKRPHHTVNYKSIAKVEPKLREKYITYKEKPNNYNMVLLQ